MPNFTDDELEDLVYYQDNETENFNSDSNDDLGEDLILEIEHLQRKPKRMLTREISVVGDHMWLYRKSKQKWSWH